MTLAENEEIWDTILSAHNRMTDLTCVSALSKRARELIKPGAAHEILFWVPSLGSAVRLAQTGVT